MYECEISFVAGFTFFTHNLHIYTTICHYDNHINNKGDDSYGKE